MANSSAHSLKEQLAILRAILQTAVDAIITIDSRGTIRHANAAVSNLFQFSQEELIGNNVSMLMPSPYREEHDGYIESYLRTGEAKIIGIGRELIARRKDGSPIHIDLAVSEVRVGDEMLFTGIIRDMTSRKLAEEMAQREREFADNLLATASSAVVVLNVHGRIAKINRFLEDLSGFATAEVQGLDWFETFLPSEIRDQQRRLFENVLCGASLQSNIHDIQTRSEEIRTLTWSAQALHDADDVREGVLAIGNDITELKHAETRLIERERLAAIGQMVTGLAHESRNALQRARAALDVLELDAHDNSLKLVTQSQEALGELQRLYEEVRNYAAPIILDLADIDIVRLCQQTWNHLTGANSAVPVQLKMDNQLVAKTIRCDASRMAQVFRNVFENALAVSPANSEVCVNLTDFNVNGKRVIEILIDDFGPGLTDEQSKKIFEPFFTTKTKGTGLGMPICKRIIEAHDGEITARNSDSTTGTRVRLAIIDNQQRS
ncbi:PAS domain S-box protein [Thalassoglobus sp. JC818]|uniref:PAS domain S-box protein n=1 Tax=Thalassoglobus sp. JC818 TaxID=3232136 RepID=UPI0034584DF6